jgi:universal stress protein E
VARVLYRRFILVTEASEVELFKNILCVVTADETAELTVERAASLAANNQAGLTLVSVVPRIAEAARLPDGERPSSGELQASMEARQLQLLESFAEPHRAGLDIRHEVLVGDVFLEVIRAVLRSGHDLVIKPAENPGWTARLFGSDDMHLLRKCPCPVWLTQPDEKSNYGCILAAVDLGPEPGEALQDGLNRRLLELASSLALSDFAALHVVHAWEAIGEAALRTWSDKPELASLRYVEAERSRYEAGMEQLRSTCKPTWARRPTPISLPASICSAAHQPASYRNWPSGCRRTWWSWERSDGRVYPVCSSAIPRRPSSSRSAAPSSPSSRRASFPR